MSPSRSRASSGPRPPSTPSSAGVATSRPGRAAGDGRLPTVAPEECESQGEVDATEARGHPRVPPELWKNEGRRARQHERDSGEGNGPNAERAARHDAGAVEEHPHAGQDVQEPGPEEDGRERGSGHDGGRERQREAPRRKRAQAAPRAPSLAGGGGEG